MNVTLRRSTPNDVDFVIGAEQDAENRRFVNTWTREQHLAAQASDDLAHLIIEAASDGRRVGYTILAGLANANASVELRRIVIAEKTRGFGREALRLIKAMVFDDLHAHRLWLDVKEHNVRARHVYETEGFVVEGVSRECLRTDAGYESLVVMSMLESEYRRPTTPASS